MQITREFLFAIAPGASGEIVDAIVKHQKFLAAADIVEPNHVAHFLAQCGVETQSFTRLEENLLYTSVKRLRQVWPSRFKSDAAAAPYVRNPRALANLVYGGRLGNRGVNTNDGWDYRGSGLNQTTGLYNFTVVEKETGVKCVNEPDLLRKFPSALKAACVYWRVHNLGRFADKNDVVGLTKAIQGGDGALADRKTFTARALKWVRENGGGIATLPIPQTTERTEWLRRGSKDTMAVRQLQQDLKYHGYYNGGRIDGDFGDGTDLAVREFQRDNGLVVDGVVGGKTAAALTRPASPVAPSPEPVQPQQADKYGAGLAGLLQAVLAIIASLFSKRS